MFYTLCLKVLDECLTRIHDLKVRTFYHTLIMSYHESDLSQVSGQDPQRIGIMVASHNEDTVKDSSNSIDMPVFKDSSIDMTFLLQIFKQ